MLCKNAVYKGKSLVAYTHFCFQPIKYSVHLSSFNSNELSVGLLINKHILESILTKQNFRKKKNQAKRF